MPVEPPPTSAFIQDSMQADPVCTIVHDSREDLQASDLKGRFVVPADEAAQLIARFEGKPQALYSYLMSLVEPASSLARPPISNFRVGAVGLGTSGAIYVGVNMEFPGGHLNNSIHAEQCLMLNCLLHGERGIRVLAVSEAPCGHCRQFYAELSNSDEVRFVFGAGSHWLAHHHSAQLPGSREPSNSGCKEASPRPIAAYSLDQLLPAKFGPADLMSEDESFPLLLDQQDNRVKLSDSAQQAVQQAKDEGQEALVKAVLLAEEWARKSYAPYTKSASGAAIITKAGNVYGGGYVESVAFNPSLTPFHAAWVAAVTDHIAGFDEISQVVLAQLPSAPVQHLAGIKALLSGLCPGASVTSVDLTGC